MRSKTDTVSRNPINGLPVTGSKSVPQSLRWSRQLGPLRNQSKMHVGKLQGALFVPGASVADGSVGRCPPQRCQPLLWQRLAASGLDLSRAASTVRRASGSALVGVVYLRSVAIRRRSACVGRRRRGDGGEAKVA